MQLPKEKRVRIKKGFPGGGKEFKVNFIQQTMSPKGKNWNPTGYFVYFKIDKYTIVNIRFAHEVEEVKHGAV